MNALIVFLCFILCFFVFAKVLPDVNVGRIHDPVTDTRVIAQASHRSDVDL